MRLPKPLLAAVLLALCVVGGIYSGAAESGASEGAEAHGANIAWMLTATALVMWMTPGLSFFYAGMVRRKNVISTLLQSFIALSVVSVLWIVVGFSLAFGDSFYGVIGDPRTFFMLRTVSSAPHPTLSPTVPLTLFVLFQLKFAAITPALVTGAFAERVRFRAYVHFVVLFSLVVYAPLAHATWHPDGILRKLGVVDFAGGTVVHISAGVAALAGARFLGTRAPSDEPHVPANIPFVLLGTGMLWFGWFGFNAGSALAANAQAVSAFLTTNTASASAACAWLLWDALNGKKASALGACIGAVVGLVAITPGAGFVTVGASIVIGTVAAVVSQLALHLKSKADIDDTLDVFPCHGVGGITGMLLTAVFATDGGLIHGGVRLVAVHVGALVVLLPGLYVVARGLYAFVDRISPLRVTPEEEALGLDLSQHDESLGIVRRAAELSRVPSAVSGGVPVDYPSAP